MPFRHDDRTTMADTTPRPFPGTPSHATAIDDLLRALGATRDGLASAEADARAGRFGPNRLVEQPGVPAWRLVVDEILNPLVLILLGAVVVLGFVSIVDPADSRWSDVGLILAIVVLNGALGFAQNYRAHRGIEALQRLAMPEVRVLRDGAPVTRRADELVPGDVVLLEEGDRIAADGRLLRVHDLAVDESSITGESLPVEKGTDPVPVDTPLAERRSMVYLGSSVAAGRGRFVVTDIGMATQVGAIADAVQRVREGPTPFQREVGGLARRITVVIGILIVLIAILQLTVGGQGPVETFVTAVALAVAAIPEGLPVVMTLALAFGTRRMLERRSLVRSLPVVEILGSADVICSDKTGTITEGRMSLRRLELPGKPVPRPSAAVGDPSPSPALLAAALCNNAHHGPDGTFYGDPTEVALLVGALAAGVDVDPWDRVEEIPFSSGRKMMSVVVERDGEHLVFTKGAPEVVIDRCTRIHDADGPRPMTADDRGAIAAANAALADDAFRVLALAGKAGFPASREETERELVYYGLAGLADPPREAAGPALRATREAGIRVVMITGDNPGTAAAIGRDIGLADEALTGAELERMTDGEIVERGAIFARVEPRHKLRILEAFRDRDHVVVMTGDGVNDAPALKGADVGIAMGVRGTDVARDAADMVLLDDNFATIVAAVEEGRRIATNIRKFLNYLLTGNLAEVLVILGASLVGALPITAVQILWVNLVTDSGPALALAVDPAPPGLMRHPPHRGPIVGRAMLALVGGVGGLIAAIVLATFFIGLAWWDLDTARTMTFTALVAQEYLRLVVIRLHERAPLLANRWLLLAVGVSLGLQLLLLYTPLAGLFEAVPLDLGGWAVIGIGVGIGLPAALGVTSLVRRRFGPL
jgi:Ca2+-transporting ATPase